MFELDQFNRYINMIRPWPWRTMVAICVVSFLSASLVSTLLGWLFMPLTKISTVGTDQVPENFAISANSGLAKLAVEKILERNLFNSEGLTGETSNVDTGDQMAKTQLPIKILGIIYGGTPFNGIAMVENSQSKNVNSFMVGDLLTPEAKVVEIQRDMVIMDHMGRREFAPLEEIELRRSNRKGGVKKKSTAPGSLGGNGYATDAPPDSFKEEGFERKGNNIEMTSEYKNRLLTTDFASVLQDAKASPNMVEGVLKGWRMDRIRKDSFYEKSGMQNGDVIEEINGVILSDAGQSIKLLQGLRNEGEIEIKANRNGQKITLTIKVR